MEQASQPVFIVSSGRSGTHKLSNWLNQFDNAEIHHEYLCTHIQPLAVKYYMELIKFEDVCYQLDKIYGAALSYATQRIWGDSSNKVSWLIDALFHLFPNAKFVHIVRDGRKVTSSYFHKLGNECYDSHSTAVLQAFVEAAYTSSNTNTDSNKKQPIEPPPEKKYWWPVPNKHSPFADQFRHFNQFQRMCFYWGEVHRVINDKLRRVPKQNQRTYKLEELVSDPSIAADLVRFLGLPQDESIIVQLKRPENVVVPKDFLLTREQQQQLMMIAGDVMHLYGYDQTPEYCVNY